MVRETHIKDNDLDSRKAEILKTVIDMYLEDPTPVASKTVGSNSELGVSSATIRAEMHALEESGYLSQTHTSSGRIPTDRGYRYFVDNYVVKKKPAKKLSETFERFIPSTSPNLLEEMVLLLSTVTQHTAVVVKDAVRKCKISDIHVSVLSSNRIVVGIFFDDATIDRVVIDTAQFSTSIRDELDCNRPDSIGLRCEAVLKEHLVGKPFDELKRSLVDVSHSIQFDSELIDIVLEELYYQTSKHGAESLVHVAGVSKIAKFEDDTDPRFREISSKVLGLVEQHLKLVEVIRNSLGETIDARIGTENESAELQRHTMILAPIQGFDGDIGAVGIIGPTRMDYIKAFNCISAASQAATKYMDQ